MKYLGTISDNKDLVTKEYVSRIDSRGEQLVVNGSGMLGNNTNWSSWTFDGSHSNSSPGSFTRTSKSYANIATDEFFPVNSASNYLVSLDMMSSNGLATAYLYLAMYDVDKIAISTDCRMWRPNTLTSLTQDLKNGDTVVHLADLTNWDVNTATRTYQRGFIFWNYKNSFGFQYPENTYSRNRWSNLYTDANVNKTSKTITLSSAWNHGTIPAGTKLSQTDSGGTYMYLAIKGSVVPSTWTKYSQYISGVDNTGGQVNGKFWAGTAYAKIGFLWNYNSANDQLWATNISMKEVIGYTFTNGTNGFTVTPNGGTAQIVTVTPSITNNITGSGTSGNITKFNGANTITSASASDIVSTLGTTSVNRTTGDKNGNDITTTYTPLSSGFGRALSGVSKSNWNTIDNTVAFYATSTATSKPTGTDHCGLQIAYGSTWKYQLAFDYRTDTIYTRACENGTWHDWYPIYTSAKIIPISNGGTGGTTAAAARTNLGLGTAAVAGLGTANGAASLGSDGKVPSSQLPTIPTVPSATNSATTGISIAAHGTGTVIGVQSSTTTASKASGANGTAPTLGTAISLTGVQSSTTTASKVTVGSHSTDYGVKSAGSGSFTSGAFSGGSGSFSATVTNHVLSFSHTHTAATHGADSHTHTAPTLGSKVPTVSASDVTVPIKNTNATSIPNVTSAGSASTWSFTDVTVPIKNTSASTFVTGTSHTVTDNGHTHTLD